MEEINPIYIEIFRIHYYVQNFFHAETLPVPHAGEDTFLLHPSSCAWEPLTSWVPSKVTFMIFQPVPAQSPFCCCEGDADMGFDELIWFLDIERLIIQFYKN